jgi:DNA repair exonuclease SbcCD nuclease subunit
MLNLSGKKIACISDIHLGVHQDSQQWHAINMKFVRWLDETLKLKNINDIIIAGDIFHNRHEIGVNTLNLASEFFNVLKDYNIVAITGNHDCYYRDKSDVNSISILNKENMQVFSELRVFNYRNKTICFCPWGVSLDQIPKCDILIGHFEILNFKMNHHKVCDHGFETESILDKAGLVISGHFHYREHRKYSNGRSILYLGSPFELDFGDRDQTKGISILDFETNEIEFIENTLTPKHIKLSLSSLLEGKITNIQSLVQGNIVSLNVDTKMKSDSIDTLTTRLLQFKPLQFRTEYNFFDTDNALDEEIDQLSIDVETAFHEFINLLSTDVDKNMIINKCLEIYKISQTTNE